MVGIYLKVFTALKEAYNMLFEDWYIQFAMEDNPMRELEDTIRATLNEMFQERVVNIFMNCFDYSPEMGVYPDFSIFVKEMKKGE